MGLRASLSSAATTGTPARTPAGSRPPWPSPRPRTTPGWCSLRATSNTEYSTDGGVTWTNVPVPVGPPDTPTPCCDNDIVIDDARRVIIHSMLYSGPGMFNNIVRVFVRRSLPTVAGSPAPASCFYDLDPSGTENNIQPDFPHLGLTKKFLYLGTNEQGAVPSGQRARMYRVDLDQLVDCPATVSFSAFTQQPASVFGQRIWVPVQGTNNTDVMYWGQFDDANDTAFRIFSQRDGSSGNFAVIRALPPTTFSAPNSNCSGGVNNVSWFNEANNQGFSLRGALGRTGLLFLWAASPDAVHTQVHVHAARFDPSTMNLLDQPHIFSNNLCTARVDVSANKRGDFAVTLARGGRNAGGGGIATAVKGYVTVMDEFTGGVFGPLVRTADGTHNADRFGDYFTIRPHEPDHEFFTATNYALQLGTDLGAVNSRYIEFGRMRYLRSYNSHRDQFPVQ